MSRLLVATFMLFSIAACGSAPLATVSVNELDALAAAKPTAILFSTRGCRYCDIAERGFSNASKALGDFAHVRKVMVGPDNVRALRARFGLEGGTPDARLILPGGSALKLPLTREGDVVAKAVREAVNAPKARRSQIAAP